MPPLPPAWWPIHARAHRPDRVLHLSWFSQESLWSSLSSGNAEMHRQHRQVRVQEKVAVLSRYEPLKAPAGPGPGRLNALRADASEIGDRHIRQTMGIASHHRAPCTAHATFNRARDAATPESTRAGLGYRPVLAPAVAGLSVCVLADGGDSR